MLFGFVREAIQSRRSLVRIDLLHHFARRAFHFHDQSGFSATLFQIFDGHIPQFTGLHNPSAICGGIDHMQLLAGDLVQILLRAQ